MFGRATTSAACPIHPVSATPVHPANLQPHDPTSLGLAERLSQLPSTTYGEVGRERDDQLRLHRQFSAPRWRLTPSAEGAPTDRLPVSENEGASRRAKTALDRAVSGAPLGHREAN